MNDTTKQAMFARRTAVVTVYAGDYLDRIVDLERRADAVKAAEDGLPRLNSEVPEYIALAEQHDALVKEAEATATHIKVQALPRKAWTDLCAKHPPRTVEKDKVTKTVEQRDAFVGVNEETFMEELVPLSIIEPADITPEDLAELSAAYFNNIYLTAFALNRTVGADPKADLVSRMTKTNGETSN